jgi:uncharacterized protein YlxW (UPF0749 family)
MRQRSSQLAVGAVLFILGFLFVRQLQLYSQPGGQALNELSAQDLTVLVANLTTRNNQLRSEIATLERQRDALSASVTRGGTATAQVRSDLDRIRAWSGAEPVTGPGIRVSVDGPVPGEAVGTLVNELRNAGAEGIAVGGTRLIAGAVVSGPAGGATIGTTPLGDAIELLAVGQPETLTGSLTRAGGPIAQLNANYPGVTVSVAALDRLTLPASTQDLEPKLGRPRI